MKYTQDLLLKLPEPTDFVQVEDLNENFTKIDTEIAKITDEETGIEAQLTTHLAQNEWFDAVLINGFTGVIKYCKNKHGTVFVTLTLTNIPTIAISTIIATLPVGFRPSTSVVLCVSKANILPYSNDTSLLITTDGNVIIAANTTLIITPDAGVKGGATYATYASI